MKKTLTPTSALPSKRLYLSIIADYHLQQSLCELIDNAIDNWIFEGRHNQLEIDIELDYDQQSITISDNSGGIKKEDIHLIVSPGHSRINSSSHEIIGAFGVGSKRAVVAISKKIQIKSRHQRNETLMIEIDDDWVNDIENWDVPTFQIDDIPEGTTRIELHALREKIEEDNHEELSEKLGAIYAYYLDMGGLKINLNDIEIAPISFEDWSYPPGYEPMEKSGPIQFKGFGDIEVSITGGLIKSHKELKTNIEEYGVYFYCNNRLVSRAYKGFEVGFSKPPKIGKPHPSMSLARVIVKLNGPVELMPWNSSKTQIDFKHKSFEQISDHIQRMLFVYASMSKNWSGSWKEKGLNRCQNLRQSMFL